MQETTSRLSCATSSRRSATRPQTSSPAELVEATEDVAEAEVTESSLEPAIAVEKLGIRNQTVGHSKRMLASAQITVRAQVRLDHHPHVIV